jgi:hypothetical protein
MHSRPCEVLLLPQVWTHLLGRAHTKQYPRNVARFQAGNWFPDYQAHTEETYV